MPPAPTGDRRSVARTYMGWNVLESGPADAAHAVLLLPGGLCSAVFFDGLISHRRLAGAPLRFVAATLPGFCGTAPLDDLRFERYAAAAARLAADLGCDVIVGHSMGANVAIEMLGGGFNGSAVLLSPSFSRADEAAVLGLMDRLGRIPGAGRLGWAALLKIMPRAMRGELAPDRADALVAELRRNDPRFCRAAVRHYFAYLDAHGSLVDRLCGAGQPAWVGFGDGKGEVGLTDDERRALERCAHVELVTIAGSGHFTLDDTSGVVVQMLLDAVDAVARV